MLVTVIDLEWTTNAVNWPWQRRDIVEIGACQLDSESGWLFRPAGCVVKPTSARVSTHCTELTGITQAQAANGIPFTEACNWLQTRYGMTDAWASFGDSDRLRLAAQCRREGIPFPLSSNHIDIRRLSERHFEWWHRRSLIATLAALDLKFRGRPHSALADAENAARVLRAM